MRTRSYTCGTKGYLPVELPADLARSAKAVVRRSVGQYVLNLASVTDRLCTAYGKQGYELSQAAERPLSEAELRKQLKLGPNWSSPTQRILNANIKAQLNRQQKARKLAEFLGRPEFFYAKAQFLFSGYLLNHPITTLLTTSEFRGVSRSWIKDTARGLRNKLDQHVFLPPVLCLSEHRRYQQELREAIDQQLSAPQKESAAKLLNYLQKNHLLTALHLPCESLLALLPERFHEGLTTLYPALNTVTVPPSPFPLLEIGLIQAAVTELREHYQEVLAREEVTETTKQALSPFLSALRILETEDVAEFLQNFPVIAPKFQGIRRIAKGLSLQREDQGRRKRNLSSALSAVLALAWTKHFADTKAYQESLRQLPEIITPPFGTRKAQGTLHAQPFPLISPKYLFFRTPLESDCNQRSLKDIYHEKLNNDALTTYLVSQYRSQLLEGSRHPKCSFLLWTAKRWSSMERFIDTFQTHSLLTGQELSKLSAAIGWGTNTKPRYRAIRRQLQSHEGLTAYFKGRLAVEVIVPHSLMHRLLAGAQIKQLVLTPPTAGCKKINVICQCSGTESQFCPQQIRLEDAELVVSPGLSTNNPLTQIACTDLNPTLSLGVDLNRLSSAYPVVVRGITPEGVVLPKASLETETLLLQELNERYIRLDLQRRRLQRCLRREKKNVHTHQLKQIGQKEKNLYREAERLVAHGLVRVLVCTHPKVLGLEDLELRTKGTRGKLAKIIRYMVKHQDRLVHLIRRWVALLGLETEVMLVNPRGTSRFCADCGNVLQHRDADTSYCPLCDQFLNRHANAAINIAIRARSALEIEPLL